MEQVTIPEGEKGPWKIKRVTVERMDWHSAQRGRHVPLGSVITVLTRRGKLVMSDTPAEMRDHDRPVWRATGSCLINGLGLGMVLKNVLLNPKVTDVTVIEISQDLIDLVAPHYPDPRLQIICADALTWKPPKGKRYQMVWHDIWDDIIVTNLATMEKLHRKYGGRADWQDSWSRAELRRER